MSKVLMTLLIVSSLVSAFDYAFGNKLKLGTYFVKGFQNMGMLMLSMVGIYTLSPLIGKGLNTALSPLVKIMPIDPSVFVGLSFAPDMGGYPTAMIVAENAKIGMLSGAVLSSMLGATLVFTLPIAIGMIKKTDQMIFIKGLLYGLITVPFGGFISGLILDIPVLKLLLNLLPVLLFSVLMSYLLYKKPHKIMTIFSILSKIILITSTFGLALGILDLMLGVKVINGLVPLEEGLVLVGKITIVLSGAYPLLNVLTKVIQKYFSAVNERLHINSSSLLGLISTLTNCVPMFMTYDEMDDRGKLLNAAFVVGGGYVLGGQLAYVSTLSQVLVTPFVVGKLFSGIMAVLLASIVFSKQEGMNENK